MERTWTIADLDGKNPRVITLAQYLAEVKERVVAARPITDAWRRGDLAACEAAQTAFRKQFS